MKKETFYFSHDYNAHDDPKMIKLRMKHGWEAYGLFWAIIEKMAQEDGGMIEADFEFLSFDFRCEVEKLRAIFEDFSLFKIKKIDGKKFYYSERLLEHKNKREEIKKNMSELGKKGAKKRWGKGAYNKGVDSDRYNGRYNDSIAVAIKSDSVEIAKERKGKEIKGKERKVNKLGKNCQNLQSQTFLKKSEQEKSPPELSSEQKKVIVKKWKNLVASEEFQFCDVGYAEKTVEQARKMQKKDREEFVRKCKLCIDWAKNSSQSPTVRENFIKKSKIVFHEIAGLVNDRGDCKPNIQ